MIQKKTLFYILAFLVGIGIAAAFLFWLFSFEFFGLGASTYKSFTFFCIFYGILGTIFGLVRPEGSWVYGVILGLPMFILLGLNFSDSSPYEQLPRILAALSPFMACVGAFWGARIALKRKKI